MASRANEKRKSRVDYKKMIQGEPWISDEDTEEGNKLSSASALLQDSKPCGILEKEQASGSQAFGDNDESDVDSMKEELRNLEKEERSLLAQREKEMLRRKLKEKRETVKALKGNSLNSLSKSYPLVEDNSDIKRTKSKINKNSSSQKCLDKKVSLQSLRQDNVLRRKVHRYLQHLGLEEASVNSSSCSDSDTSDNSVIECTSSGHSSDDDFHSNPKKNVKKKISHKSGIEAKASDRVKMAQKYPHSQLRYEFVDKSLSFNELSMNLFIAGELEIISDQDTSSKERRGRTDLLKRVSR